MTAALPSRAPAATTLDSLLRAHMPHLADAIAREAGRLAAAGVQRGDAVCFLAPNVDATVVTYRACWRLGAVAVPIHHLAGPDDVDRIVTSLRPVVAPGDALPDGDSIADDRAEPDDIAVVLHTSGSSGIPKGVRHAHRALASKGRTMAEVHGLGADDAVLMPAPLAHVSGLLAGILTLGAIGGRTVLMERWDPNAALDIIERERITFMVGPPTFFLDLMAAPSFTPARVESLRLVSSGGAGITPAFVEKASMVLGCTVKRTYGSTEAPSITTTYAGDDPARARATDGRPIGDVELRTDAATGELEVRGSDLFVGYTDPDATAAAFTPDGWFRTGDVGVIDDDGWLTIVGRIKDVIIRGGENISAAEVEGVLEAHPDVVAAVAVGYPDERLGERVAAFVVAPIGFGLPACQAWFAEQGVARFKVPERVVVVDDFPRLPSGKADREALRRVAAAAGA